jgi:cyanophycinase
MGGGPDVDEAFRWMARKSGRGDMVVLRATGADGYNDYIYAMGLVDSVETLVVKSREAAADPFVIDRINRAELIFIAGGDQSDYLTLWKGTPLHAALERALARRAPIGGTSAGLAVLGHFDFAAYNGTIDSIKALNNPYDRRLTLDRGFLMANGLGGLIADAHLDTRDRMGRLVTFLARLVNAADGWLQPSEAGGIGVDVETALVIDNGTATRLGVGSVYFLKPTIAPTVCVPKQPLTFRNVMVDRLSGDGNFDLGTWRGRGTVSYDLSAENGTRRRHLLNDHSTSDAKSANRERSPRASVTWPPCGQPLKRSTA